MVAKKIFVKHTIFEMQQGQNSKISMKKKL